MILISAIRSIKASWKLPITIVLKDAGQALRSKPADIEVLSPREGFGALLPIRYIYITIFLPNKRLDGKTPAEAMRAKLPYCLSKWKLFCKFL